MFFHHNLLCTDYKNPILSCSASSIKSFKELKHHIATQACSIVAHNADLLRYMQSSTPRSRQLQPLKLFLYGGENVFPKCRRYISIYTHFICMCMYIHIYIYLYIVYRHIYTHIYVHTYTTYTHTMCICCICVCIKHIHKRYIYTYLYI